MAWTIEAEVLPLGGVITVGSHLYVDIFDDTGKLALQINGLATNRKTGEPDTVGDNTDQLKGYIGSISNGVVTSGVVLDGTSGAISNPNNIIFSGSQSQVMTAVSYAEAAIAYINDQNFSYSLLSFNSNSFFSGIIAAMGESVAINQQTLQNVINSAFNPAAVGVDIFQGDTWAPNLTANVGSIVHMTGSSFNHTIYGTSGDDQLFGASGNDTFFGSKGNDAIQGGGGSDTVNYSVLLDSGVGITVNMTGFNGTVNKGIDGIDNLNSIANIVGTSSNDTFNLGTTSGLNINGGGGLVNTVNYSEDGLTVSGSMANLVVTDSTSHIDKLTGIQHLVLTGNNDIINLSGPSGLTIDGTPTDTVNYSSGGTYNFNTHTVTDSHDQHQDILNGFSDQNIHTNATTVLPSLHLNENLTPGPINYNYSDATTGATIFVQAESDVKGGFNEFTFNYIYTAEAFLVETVTLNNGVTDSGSYGAESTTIFDSTAQEAITELENNAFNGQYQTVLTGTNFGDNVILSNPLNLGVIPPPSIFFSSGSGNDNIAISNGGVASTVEYRGGNDVIQNASHLAGLQFWEGISLSDLSLSTSSGGYADGGHNLTISVAGFGSETLEDITGIRHPGITLLSGGSITFDAAGNASLTGTSQFASAINGTWGDDTWTGRANATQIFYGLGGTNVMTAGNGAHDTLVGGGDTNTFNSNTGVNLLDGGSGQNTYNVSKNATTTIDAPDGTNTVHFTDSNLSNYTLASNGTTLAFLDSSLHPVLTIDDTTAIGNITFANGQSFSAATLYQQAQTNPLASLYFGLGAGNDTFVISSATQSAISETQGLNNIQVSDLAHTNFTYTINGDTMELFAGGSTTPFANVSGIGTFSTITFSDDFTVLVSSLIAGTPHYIDGSFGEFDATQLTSPISVHLTDDTTFFLGSNAGNIVWTNGDNGSSSAVVGGSGNDILHSTSINGDFLRGAGGNNVIDGGAPNNQTFADYAAAPSGIVANLGAGIVSQNGYGGTDTLINIREIIGSSHNDIITGSSGNNVFIENAGNNTIDGGGGTDLINYASAQAGVTVNLTTGIADHVNGTDTLINIANAFGSALGSSNLIGNSGDNSLEVFGSNNVVNGMGGNDTLTIGFGTTNNNIIYGGSGNTTINIFGTGTGNTIILQPLGGADVINDHNANSTLQIEGVPTSGLSYTQVGNDLVISYDDSVTIKNFFSTPSESYQVALDNGQTSTLSALVAATPLNHAPVAQPDSFTDTPNSMLGANVLVDNGNGADSDPDGDALSVLAQSVQSAAGGTVVFSSTGDFTYTPANNFVGTDSFSYTLSDGRGGTATGTASVTITAAPPDAQEDDFTSMVNQTVTGNVLADNGHGEDFDPNGSFLTVGAITESISNGSVTINNDGSFVFTPTAGFTGSASFDYVVADGFGETATGLVNLTIRSNLPPVAQPDNFTDSFGQTLTGNVLTNNGHGPDTDPNGLSLSVLPITEATSDGGSVVLHADGTFSYVPLLGFAGNDSFAYTLTDGSLTATTTVTVTVTAPAGAIVGTNGDDTINGGSSNQTILGLGGNDHLNGGNGNDLIYGGSGNDAINGGNGNDTLYAVAGNNTLHGNNGDDKLYAGSGNDLLYGDNGDDLLVVGTGPATLTGGNGNDTFKFTDIHGYGTVTDYKTGQDKLDLSQLIEVSNPAQQGINNFVHATTQGNNTVISVDADGAANGAHFVAVATLQGVHNFDVAAALANGSLIA